MKHHKITGGGGIQLHIVESGNPKGRPILFIHGISQCWLAWNHQLHSDLEQDHRLVAMDLRGHGLSEKPLDAYSDTKLWADDIHATIQFLNLDQPILSGWSYGTLVIFDYLRHYGEANISGIQLVGGITGIGREEAQSALTPEFLNLIPGFFSNEVGESVRSLEGLLHQCFAQLPPAHEMYMMLGYNVLVPPYVREAMLYRTVDNDDLLSTLCKPVLITHGTLDKVVKPAAIHTHKARIAHAQIHLMENSGHAPFSDDVAGFNQRLREFSESLS